MHYRLIKAVLLGCLTCAIALSLFGGSAGAQNHTAHHAVKSVKAARDAAWRYHIQVVKLKKAIVFYRRATWHEQDAAMLPHTRTSYAEKRISGKEYLRWSAQLWQTRSRTVRRYVLAHPWVRMVHETYAYRQCLITDESRTSGLYRAENGGTRGSNRATGDSDASGAYQFLDSTWQTRFAAAKAYFKGKLKGSWTHAADAPPDVQDAVAAYAIVADKGVDWTHPACRAIRV